MKIQLRGSWEKFRLEHGMMQGYVERDTKALMAAFLTISEADEALIAVSKAASNNLLAIAVPSVHDDQWNVLLRPVSSHFERLVSLVEVKPFSFDPRLFPEEAIEERD